MSIRLLLLAITTTTALSLSSCSGPATSHISGVVDLPLKHTAIPGSDWQHAPLRANATYHLYKMNTRKQKANRIGDYYYVDWYDAEPTKPTQLVMTYTQAKTASRLLTRSIDYPAPRKGKGTTKAVFEFNGPERHQDGDILTWKMELKVDGKVVDSCQSYLWE